MNKSTGGPAFPATEAHGLNSGDAGMTLRDYFAAKVAAGDASSDEGWGANEHVRDEQIEKRVALYYRVADAMVAARNSDTSRAELVAALKACVSVMDRDLNGLAVIQPELSQARAALTAAGAA